MGAGHLMPFGPSPFSLMGGMMHNMDNMMRNMVRGCGFCTDVGKLFTKCDV